MRITASRLDVAALREVLGSLLGLPGGALIAADLAAPTPPGLHASLREMQSTEQGRSRREFDGGNERERVCTRCDTTFRLSAFGPGALELLQDARSVLQSSHAAERLHGLRVALSRLSALENLSGVEAGQVREAARIDLILGHEHRVVLEQQRIATSTVAPRTSSGLTAEITVSPTET